MKVKYQVRPLGRYPSFVRECQCWYCTWQNGTKLHGRGELARRTFVRQCQCWYCARPTGTDVLYGGFVPGVDGAATAGEAGLGEREEGRRRERREAPAAWAQAVPRVRTSCGTAGTACAVPLGRRRYCARVVGTDSVCVGGSGVATKRRAQGERAGCGLR
eukprot:2264444-Rhodomonas_salina.2